MSLLVVDRLHSSTGLALYIPYEFKKCVICRERDTGDPEHVIPQMLGGHLSASLLCDECNHRFGTTLVAGLKQDPPIRLAVERLEGVIPDLASSYLDKAEYVAKGADGSKVRLSRKGEELQVLAGEGVNESIVMDTDDALAALVKKLERAGVPEERIANYQKRFRLAGEGKPVAIPTGETFLKRPLPEPVPYLARGEVDDRFWALMAIEFIALNVGNRVLETLFDECRSFILTREPPQHIRATKLRAGRQYGPFHVVRLVDDSECLAVEIRLFRCLVTQLYFQSIGYRGPHSVYLEDLEHKRSYLAPTASDARQNNWIEFQS